MLHGALYIGDIPQIFIEWMGDERIDGWHPTDFSLLTHKKLVAKLKWYPDLEYRVLSPTITAVLLHSANIHYILSIWKAQPGSWGYYYQ